MPLDKNGVMEADRIEMLLHMMIRLLLSSYSLKSSSGFDLSDTKYVKKILIGNNISVKWKDSAFSKSVGNVFGGKAFHK